MFNPFLGAFRPGMGCQSTLLRLVEDWRKALDSHKYVAAILLDLTKAFDCLPHSLLLDAEVKSGFQNTTKAQQLNTAKLNTISHRESFEQEMDCALAQWEEKKSSTPAEEWAALQQVCTGCTAEEVQIIVDAFSEASKKLGLKINIKKTEVLYQRNCTRTLEEEIMVGVNKLNSVLEFTYFGSTISSNGCIDDEIQRTMTKASASFGRLRQRLWNNHHVSMRVKGKIYRTIVRFTLLYGAQYTDDRNGGICLKHGKCECKDEYSGPTCEPEELSKVIDTLACGKIRGKDGIAPDVSKVAKASTLPNHLHELLLRCWDERNAHQYVRNSNIITTK
ncbi:hypothetical protein NP493_1410g00014 [Ridgeia piscesae]|uniref:EGF-like domain-containing protein n=1 Tax=Ridgeia piscesae TaxID=27915 RepID=A0AAD9NDQ4_RIDPI|nr:hypothetical protein NP493_1410g00014 [Ridgeia piscesae]